MVRPMSRKLSEGWGLCPPSEETKELLSFSLISLSPCAFQGRTPLLDELCCTNSLTPTFEPDFSDLVVADNPDCQSNTVQYIAEQLCLGNQNCTLRVDYNLTYEWVVPLGREDLCGPVNIFNGTFPVDYTVCQARFSSDGTFSGCEGRNMNNNYMTAIIKCIQRTFTIWGVTYSNNGVAKFMSELDAAMVIIFLIVAYLVSTFEREEIKNNILSQCTAKDYTVLVTNIPKTQDLLVLQADLRDHFTRMVNAAPPVYESDVAIRLVDVNMVLTDTTQIGIMRERGRLARKLDAINTRISLLEKYTHTSALTLQLMHLQARFVEAQFIRANRR
jgi:hypothetical protein